MELDEQGSGDVIELDHDFDTEVCTVRFSWNYLHKLTSD